MKKQISKKQIIVLVLLTFFFFSCSAFIFWDSAHYISYLDILEGNKSWGNWDMIRGIVFPLAIHISNILFGKNNHGLLILMYIFYLLMLKTLDSILNNYFYEKNSKTQAYKIVIYIFIIINPIVFGYYHAVLTEYMAITVSLISCYLSYKYVYITYDTEKKEFYKYLILFSIITLFSYHLKQTYITIALCPLLLSVIISSLTNRNIKNIISKISSWLFCCLFLILSIIIWNNFLYLKGVETNTERNATNLIGVNILNGMNVDTFIPFDLEDKNIKYLSQKEISKLKSNIDNYYIINIIDENKVIDQMLIQKNKNGVISTIDALLTSIKIFLHHPITVLDSYFSNYMALINLYSKTTKDTVSYKVEKKLTFNYCHENCEIAFATNDYRTNINYLSNELASKVILYQSYNNPPILINKMLNLLEPIYEKVFQLIYLLLPFLLVINIIMLFIKKVNFDKNNLILSTILLGFAFLHVLSCMMLYLTIDRYCIASFIPCFLGEILLIFTIINMNRKRGKYERKI